MRGDHDLNEVKAGKLEGLKGGFRFATAAEIDAHFGCKPGYLGPIGLKQPVKVIADRTVANMSDFVCGANEADFHFTGANWGRDLPEPDLVADIRNVVEGDPSPGFVVGRVTASPATVEVTGPESAVKRATEAITESVSVSGARDTVTDEVTVGFQDPTLRLRTATAVTEHGAFCACTG